MNGSCCIELEATSIRLESSSVQQLSCSGMFSKFYNEPGASGAGKVGCIHIWLHHMLITKIHLSPVATLRRTFVQIPSTRIPSWLLKLSENKNPEFCLWYCDSHYLFLNVMLKIVLLLIWKRKNLITLSNLENKLFKKYSQVSWRNIWRSLRTEFLKMFFSVLLQVKGVFWRLAHDVVICRCGLPYKGKCMQSFMLYCYLL